MRIFGPRSEPLPVAEPEWVPGDPLHEHGPYRNYLYNFRTTSEATDGCPCPDSATWPEPIRHKLPEGDELGDFIREYHQMTEEIA